MTNPELSIEAAGGWHPVRVVLSIVLLVAGVALCEISHHRGGLTVAGLVMVAVGMVWLLTHYLRRQPRPR